MMPRISGGDRNFSFRPARNQLLHYQDDDCSGLQQLSQRRATVDRRVRYEAEDLAGDPPEGPFAPHHKGHPVLCPQVAVGHEDYTKVGRYYVLCADPTEECKRRIRYVTDRLPEEFLLLHETLTPLLIMREELQPTPRTIATRRSRLRRRITIKDSPLWPDAVDKFYLRKKPKDTLPPQVSTSTPAQSQHILTPQAFEKPETGLQGVTQVSPSVRLSLPIRCSDSIIVKSDDTDTRAGPSNRSVEVIELFDSDEETDVKVPIVVVFWTKASFDRNNVPYTPLVFSYLRSDRFCINDHASKFKDCGVDLSYAVEVYSPDTKSWRQVQTNNRVTLGWNQLSMFLMRYKGVDCLRGFVDVCMGAEELPESKGKGRA
ncbi:hypothetical protein CVT26_016203 [Gymnopilus dilepis]|uniref:Uncharacterized protein n=1 Tax=Gymnopilus dilepis TaxID=231916 RepID=A0A409XYX8_9AGAR|nr:hypothetical protein CVT26_016203 [Gymnopilus dilepis]